MSDRETLEVYNRKAAEYAALTDAPGRVDPSLQAFMARLPEAAVVLDLGCGPGTASAIMAQAGFAVEAVDASEEMVALAARHDGVTARVAGFDGVDDTARFDGIWANFSLLHAARDQMPRHLSRLHRAMKPGGVFHIGMKLGTGARRDGIGRYYTYYSDAELTGLLQTAGFTMDERTFGRDKGLDGTMADWICMLGHA